MEEKKEAITFDCETNLKSDFYRMAQNQSSSPASLFRRFMKKTVQEWKTKNKKSFISPSIQENYDEDV